MKIKKIVIPDKNEMLQEQEREIMKLVDNVKIYNDIPKTDEEIIKRIGDADAILTSWITINKKIIDSCKNLKYIGVIATGYSWIDTKAAKEKGVVVTNVPAYATESVAELVICQIISMLRNTKEADFRCRKGKFMQEGLLGEEIKGKTIGIVGLGKIGSRVAELANAFGMSVIYNSKTEKNENYQYCNLNDLLKKSDIITLHTNSGDELIGEKELKLLKNGAIIVNFGVAGNINEDALIKELESGRLKAILDHYADHKIKAGFIESKNTLLTPEIGFYTKQALQILVNVSIDNLEGFLDGKIQNKVN